MAQCGGELKMAIKQIRKINAKVKAETVECAESWKLCQTIN